MGLIIEAIIIWFLVSIPASLLIGSFLALTKTDDGVLSSAEYLDSEPEPAKRKNEAD